MCTCKNPADHIIAVTNRHLTGRPLAEQVGRVCRLRPRAVILREKDLPEPEYAALAKDITEICREHKVPCILHTFIETAIILSCPAIHLPLPLLRRYGESMTNAKEMTLAGEKNIPSTDAAGISLRNHFTVIGTSVHSVEEALEAQQLGATYLTAGHIYATDCKKGLPPRGLDFLRAVCDSVSIPVYAIGGIRLDAEQLEEVMSCGAEGGCIMSGMMKV